VALQRSTYRCLQSSIAHLDPIQLAVLRPQEVNVVTNFYCHLFHLLLSSTHPSFSFLLPLSPPFLYIHTLPILLTYSILPDMDSFNAHDITVARHMAADTQRMTRERDWSRQLRPHLSDDELQSYYAIAEALIQHGFTGSYNQTTRLARAIRTMLLDERNLTLDTSLTFVMGPRLQALRDAPTAPAPAALPPPFVQALINAQTYQSPATAANDTETATDQSLTTAEQPSPTSQHSPATAEQPRPTSQESPATAEQPRPTSQESPDTAEQPLPISQESPARAEQSSPSGRHSSPAGADQSSSSGRHSSSAVEQSLVTHDMRTQADQNDSEDSSPVGTKRNKRKRLPSSVASESDQHSPLVQNITSDA
jgi:hypothetical protein